MKINLVTALSLAALTACGSNTINTTSASTGTNGSGSTGTTSSSTSSTSSGGSGSGSVSQTVSGSASASVLTTDGSGVNVPAGALSQSTTITVTPTSGAALPTNATQVGVAPLVISASASFSTAVTVVVSFNPAAMPSGSSPSDIIVQSEPNGLNAFFPLATTVVDSTHVSVQTTQANAVFVATIPDPNCGVVLNYPGNTCAWGVAVGNTFPDVSLAGGAVLNFATTEAVDNTADMAQSFTFAQLQGLSTQGFRYAFLDVSAVWCPHCNEEAQDLPGGYVKGWLAEGGIIFSILVQSGSPNDQGIYPPASQSDLTAWISKYKINYPMSLDSQQNMVTTTGLTGWPANLIVRLSDMTVIDSVFGATDAFYSEFSGVLATCSTDADCWSGASCSSGQCH